MGKATRRFLRIGFTLLGLGAAIGGGAPASARPLGAPPAEPNWPDVALNDQIRGALLGFYRQRDDAALPAQAAAPRWEAEKAAAAKDPDSLWEVRGGAGTACHAAVTRADFIACAGHRLAATFAKVGYDGTLSLFDPANYYANDTVARMANFYGLYHAFVHDHDSDLPAGVPYTVAEARRSKDYHRAMVRAYEAHSRELIMRMFRETRGDPSFQVSLTRTAGLLEMSYVPLVAFLEREQAWGANRDRRNAFSLINGLNQRIWWEWVWSQTNGPATAGFVNLGSQSSYDLGRPANGALDGTDHFRYSFDSGDEDIASLRTAAVDSGSGGIDGYWFDADYPPPGDWWCYGTFGLTASDALQKCLDMSARGSQTGSRSAPGPFSPYGQYYGNPGAAQPCTDRLYSPSGHSCGDTNLGSIAEEWLWSLSGARMGLFVIERLAVMGDPDLPARNLGGFAAQRVPLGLSPALSPYEHVTERLGYGVAGFHGGTGLNDDLEWTWSANGVVRAIRTLSAGLHDGEEQNGRLSVGEGDVPPGADPASRLGSTWDRFAYKDHQEYPGAMENHSAGPSPIYGTTLFGLVLGDRTGDAPRPAGGMAGSLFDGQHRNTVDEFQNWVWLYQATYHRCPPPSGQADDPAAGACFDRGGSRRRRLYAPPDPASPTVRFDYLWRSHDAGTATELIDQDGHIAAAESSCGGRPGVPWRQVYNRDLTTGATLPGGGQTRLLTDESGLGAYNELIQGGGGLMRLVAARYPVNAGDPAFAIERTAVLKPWYDEAYTTVADIFSLFTDTLGYVPDIENSNCLGTNPDPGDPSLAMISWQQGTGATTQATAIRRAMWYSIASNWYWWYDPNWLVIDPQRW